MHLKMTSSCFSCWVVFCSLSIPRLAVTASRPTLQLAQRLMPPPPREIVTETPKVHENIPRLVLQPHKGKNLIQIAPNAFPGYHQNRTVFARLPATSDSIKLHSTLSVASEEKTKRSPKILRYKKKSFQNNSIYSPFAPPRTSDILIPESDSVSPILNNSLQEESLLPSRPNNLALGNSHQFQLPVFSALPVKPNLIQQTVNKNVLHTPTNTGKILFSNSLKQNLNSWTPVYRGSVLPALLENDPTSQIYEDNYINFLTPPDITNAHFANNLEENTQESEFVFHLNSTDRIIQLINVLTNYINNPSEELLSSRFASISEDQATFSQGSHPNDISYKVNVRDVDNKFLTTNYVSPDFDEILIDDINFPPYQHDLSIFQGGNALNFGYFPVLTDENSHHISTKSDKEAPSPIQIDVDEQVDPFSDLIPSASETFAGITTARKDGRHFPMHYRIPKKFPLSVKTRASTCPKLNGGLTLTCQIEQKWYGKIKTKKWLRRSISSENGFGKRTLISLDDAILINDRQRSGRTLATIRDNKTGNSPSSRFKIENSPISYSLTNKLFKIEDIGAYECVVEDSMGNKGRSQIIVYACL